LNQNEKAAVGCFLFFVAIWKNILELRVIFPQFSALSDNGQNNYIMNDVEFETQVFIGKSRTEFFRELYEEAFYPVAAYVSKNGGSFEIAKDIFHDALIIYCEKEFRDTNSISSPKAYVIGIAKHLWQKHVGLEKRLVDIEGVDLAADSNNSAGNEVKLLSWIEKTSRKCLDILQAFYYEKKNTTQITTDLGYSSVHSTTVQKYKCLEKLRDEVKQKSLTYEDFAE
jgi:DNA-directed RNA polymerase specialized sigma24 family protein